jgi:exodeoxyribonuclease VII small subunit
VIRGGPPPGDRSAVLSGAPPTVGPMAETPVDGLTYEQARAALTDVVHRLEAGGTTLEESLALWERGEALADACQAWLDGARKRLDTARGVPEEQGDAG